MCIGCREEFEIACEEVELGHHIATGINDDFFVPCMCKDIDCDKEHLHLKIVDDKGELVLW